MNFDSPFIKIDFILLHDYNIYYTSIIMIVDWCNVSPFRNYEEKFYLL